MAPSSRMLKLAGLAGLAFGGYAAYAQYAIRKFENLDPLSADAPGSYLDIDGTLIHYVEAGKGKDVVLIHGWNGSTFSFRHTIPELAQHFRVIALDLKGYGYSARDADGDYSLTAQADIVAQVMDRLGVKDVAVVGHSMGGAVAMRLALRHPDWVKKLVLVDSVTVAHRRPTTRFGKLLSPLMPLGVPFLQRRDVQRRVLLSAVHDPAYVTLEIEDAYFKPLHMRGHFQALRRQLLSRRDDDLESPEHIAQPTLILWGEHDSWLGPEFGEELADRIPNAELTMVPSAAHLPLEEQPEFCNRELLRFLGDGGQTAATEAAEVETAG